MDSVFLSFHFEPRSQVVGCAEELIESHGLRVVTGLDLGGGGLTEEIQRRIRQSDAVVSVLSRDVALADGSFRAAAWVEDELKYARSVGKKAIALVERGTETGGMYGYNERIEVEADSLLKAVLKLSRTIGIWRAVNGRTLQIRLECPEVDELYAEDAVCSYRFMNGPKVDSSWRLASLVPMAGGIFMFANGAAENAMFQIRIKSKERTWETEFRGQDLSARLERRQ